MRMKFSLIPFETSIVRYSESEASAFDSSETQSFQTWQIER